jgi:hypothetical protein
MAEEPWWKKLGSWIVKTYKSLQKDNISVTHSSDVKIGDTHNHYHFDNCPVVIIDSDPQSNINIEYNKETNTVKINTERIPIDSHPELKKIIKASQEVKKPMLEEKTDDIYFNFQDVEKIKSVQDSMSFLIGKVPDEDCDIWRKGLYIRQNFIESQNISDQNERQVRRRRIQLAKSALLRAYGDKGSNISNMCTSGYIEGMLIPLYESLKKILTEKEVIFEFHKMYRTLVYQLKMTVFVSSKKTVADIVEEIRTKLKYGFKGLNIHGIGKQNIDTINKAIEIVMKENEDKLEIIKKEQAVTILLIHIRKKDMIPKIENS